MKNKLTKSIFSVFLVLVMVIGISACAKDNSSNSNSKVNSVDYKNEALDVINNNSYTEYDLGYIKLELPWIERRYPLEMSTDSKYFSCNQRTTEEGDLESIFISIDEEAISTLERYDEWINENQEIFESKPIKSEHIDEALFYYYRSQKTDIKQKPLAYYNTYSYVFYDTDKKLIKIEIRIPENWSEEYKDIATHIFESIALPESHYPDNDFLSNEDNYKLFFDLRNKGKYDELYDVINKHLSQENIKENDSAYKIKKILEKIIDKTDNVTVKYDDIELNGVIMYKDVQDVTSSIHFVPIAYTTNDDLEVLVGFEKNDWLFFDKVIVTGENENWEISINSYDKVQDIIQGNTIRESINHQISYDNLKNISNNKNAKIRFENTQKQKNIDFPITDNEMTAINAVLDFKSIGNELYDIAKDYNKYK